MENPLEKPEEKNPTEHLSDGERMLLMEVGQIIFLAYRHAERPTEQAEVSFQGMRWQAEPFPQGLMVRRIL